MSKNISKKTNKNKGLTLTEVLITALISLIILSIFYMLFKGINLEARYAETWSDINNIVNGINSKIKQEMISCEYMFDRNDSNIILTRLIGYNNFLLNSAFPQIQSSISDFSQLNFPNNNVGNRIMFLKFLGYITLSNAGGNVAIPKYQIVMIYLSPNNINFKGYNLNLINPVISRSEYIYSNETLKSLTVISNNLKNQIQNYIFIDKDNINNLNNFFVKYDPSINPPWRVYNGIIGIISNEVVMKSFSYNNIFYSIAYNRNVSPFNNLRINYRVPVWTSPYGNFPSGLEFIVIGNKTARKLYVRTAVIAQVKLDKFYFQADNAVINFSDKF
jgi:prepilin-type N-terminal cleavage/methylation domain-containing protein